MYLNNSFRSSKSQVDFLNIYIKIKNMFLTSLRNIIGGVTMKKSKLLSIFISSFVTLSSIDFANAVNVPLDVKTCTNKENDLLEKNNKKIVSIIFEVEPKRWGFRGDPWFWRYLKELFESYDETISEDELEKIIKDEHQKLTSKELSESSYAYCEKFDHGGMSGGGLSGKFWIETGIPLLKERLRELKS